jgi:hypothetical protein
MYCSIQIFYLGRLLHLLVRKHLSVHIRISIRVSEGDSDRTERSIRRILSSVGILSRKAVRFPARHRSYKTFLAADASNRCNKLERDKLGIKLGEVRSG